MTWICEDDDWSKTGPNILSSEALAKIEAVLEQAPVILEHWFYRSSSAPDRLIFDDYEGFLTYLKSNSHPGDKIYVWNFAELCKDDNHVVAGKYPDAIGRTPRLGPY